jgi:glyoxylase-like metal-dependent hydrolase (beta-lactamase superfamily II)
MNKILKRILIITGIIIGVLVLAFGGMVLKLKSEMSGFSPMETGKVVDDIFVVRDDFANIFIIQDSTQYIVIDCATDQTVVAEQMKKLGINPNEVTAVFLTHTDGDHVGALSLFDKSILYMSKEEEQMITGKKSKFLWFGNSISRTDYTLLEDHQVVRIGNLKIEGILVPGHTSGMMAYLINNKYLFTGDILSFKDGKIAPIPAFFDMDNAQAVASMDIIRHIPTAEYIFTAHWGYTDDYKTAVAFLSFAIP